MLLFFLYGIIQFEQLAPFRVFLSEISDDRVQCPRLGLEIKIYDTSAGGIRASQGTLSSCFMFTNLAIDDSRFSFLLLFNVPVNNFPVIFGRSHRFLCIYQYFGELNVSCSRILHGGHEGSNPGHLAPESDALPPSHRGFLTTVVVVVVLGFYASPTAKVIRRRDLGLKSHPKDSRSPESNSRPLD